MWVLRTSQSSGGGILQITCTVHNQRRRGTGSHDGSFSMVFPVVVETPPQAREAERAAQTLWCLLLRIRYLRDDP